MVVFLSLKLLNTPNFSTRYPVQIVKNDSSSARGCHRTVLVRFLPRSFRV